MGREEVKNERYLGQREERELILLADEWDLGPILAPPRLRWHASLPSHKMFFLRTVKRKNK